MAIFDHLTTAILKFWPWSWSKSFDHLTMTPGRRPNGQKIVVILPPPLTWANYPYKATTDILKSIAEESLNLLTLFVIKHQHMYYVTFVAGFDHEML